MSDPLPVIDSAFPGVYAPLFRTFYDGACVTIDWRTLKMTEDNPPKPSALHTVARVTIPLEQTKLLLRELQDLLARIEETQRGSARPSSSGRKQ